MPEGVEVKISAELIKPLVFEKNIANIFVGKNSRYKNISPEGLEKFKNAISGWRVPMRVKNVSSKGKFMYWTFTNDNEDWYMFCTFGMSGQWSPVEGKHPCLSFELSNSTSNHIDLNNIYFNDPRHFGTIKFTNNKKDLLNKLNELGWDPLADKLDSHSNTLIKTINKTTKPIGQILMDQSVFSGVGNYIRAEALYQAKISPWRQGNLMTDDDIKSLCQSIMQVMEESYKYQGATLHTYKDAYGKEGQYSSCFKIYGKKIDPLGNKVIKENTPDGRAIHWCPRVQQ